MEAVEERWRTSVRERFVMAISGNGTAVAATLGTSTNSSTVSLESRETEVFFDMPTKVFGRCFFSPFCKATMAVVVAAMLAVLLCNSSLMWEGGVSIEMLPTTTLVAAIEAAAAADVDG